ncbi:fibronectin type III domain-containing protein [Nitrospira sp. NS4]|uniref:fibronectin type III domain-containing protein n=1 Tax=Nitrospira sp. NS4 TaxID=3414498 RepID=UPI003C2D5C55
MRSITTQFATTPSPSKRDSTLSCSSLGKHHSSAGCPLLIRSVAAGLILITATILTGCEGGGEGVAPSASSTSGAAGAAATLAWEPVQDPTVTGYYVHYGTQSSDQPGSCAYQYSHFVSSPTVTLTDLAPDTQYYFAVSAYNGVESTCSSEIAITTPMSGATTTTRI